MQGIIHLLTQRLGDGERHFRHLFAMRMVCHATEEVRWLHQDTTMCQAAHEMRQRGSDDWRLELRVRYLPTDLSDLYERDKTTFCCYYDQVRSDYLRKSFESIDLDLAVQLCCLELRRFFKDMPHIALDKRSNFEYLERDVGLHMFLPRLAIEQHKPKALRKLIQHQFKRVAGLGERECMIKFFDLLRGVYAFDTERFRCALGVSRYFLTCSDAI